MAEEDLEDRWQRGAAAKPVGGDLDMLKKRLAHHRQRRATSSPVVHLPLSVAQELMKLLLIADQSGDLGTCDEQLTSNGYCAVCTALEGLQLAIMEAGERSEGGGGDGSRDDR